MEHRRWAHPDRACPVFRYAFWLRPLSLYFLFCNKRCFYWYLSRKPLELGIPRQSPCGLNRLYADVLLGDPYAGLNRAWRWTPNTTRWLSWRTTKLKSVADCKFWRNLLGIKWRQTRSRRFEIFALMFGSLLKLLNGECHWESVVRTTSFSTKKAKET